MMLKDRKILFIGTGFHHYEKAIVKELEQSGAIINYFDMNPGDYKIRILQKISKNMKEKYLYSYQTKFLNNGYYDYVFVIKGNELFEDILSRLKERHKKARFILYLWDSKRKVLESEKRFKYFDKICSFDRTDCFDDARLSLLPLFYIEEKGDQGDIRFEPKKSDLYFYGSFHLNRYEMLQGIKQQIHNFGLSFECDLYLRYLDMIKGFLNDKEYAINKCSRDILIHKWLPFNLIKEKINISKAILDVHDIYQSGLSMRIVECLGVKKKVVTTNNDILNYDFYNDTNTFILKGDLSNFSDIPNFLNRTYELDDAIREKYSLKNWIKCLFD